MNRILVVDDYKPFLDDVRNSVTDSETSVLTVETSAAALREMEQSRFDVVVTDLFMETQTAEDGLSVLKAAKQHSYTQVIVVTSYGKPELSVETMRLGAFDYLERGTPGTNFRKMLASKIRLALDYRAAKLAASLG